MGGTAGTPIKISAATNPLNYAMEFVI